MRYKSTNATAPTVDVRTALAGGFAPDGGMYMPERIPRLPQAFFNNIGELSLTDIAYVVASSFFSDDLSGAEIKRIVDASFGFDAPLVPVGAGINILELFHGPTLTFKDYSARFVARTTRALESGRYSAGHRTVLVATTGNSGAATANGMFGIEDTDVVVLYPKGTLSRMQMAQFTTLGGNVHAVEVEGSIEDCKTMMRSAMADRTLEYLKLATTNSLNIGRLIPQIVFPLYAYARMKAAGVRDADSAAYAIPCGNCSNLVATLMAVEMGMPAGKIVAVGNVNDSLGRLKRGEELPVRPVATTAPSLDTVNPSCLPRLKYLAGGGFGCCQKMEIAPAVHDRDIASAILRLRTSANYTIDPHGAAALEGCLAALPGYSAPVVVYATGHPAKSLDTMTRITGSTVELPVQFNRFMGSRRIVKRIPPTLAALKRLLISL